MYAGNGRSFFGDASLAQIKNDTAARDRIDRHQHYELSRLRGTPPPGRKRG